MCGVIDSDWEVYLFLMLSEQLIETRVKILTVDRTLRTKKAMIINGINTKGLCVSKDSLQKRMHKFLPQHDSRRDYGCHEDKEGIHISKSTEVAQERIHR